MSGPTDALDVTRPIPGDDSGQLPETLRNIKTQLVANKAAHEANATAIAAVAASLGDAAERDIFASTAEPDPLLGEDGDLWIQHDA